MLNRSQAVFLPYLTLDDRKSDGIGNKRRAAFSATVVTVHLPASHAISAIPDENENDQIFGGKAIQKLNLLPRFKEAQCQL
ncbi:MAG TPA: hypothetical protein VGR78_11645 [Verrucomicrobiae bacterium]|nr:hypothetical protein [Verrucomicrobiae bacterium]